MNILKTEKPQTIANILNGKQTILVMKKAPKNGVGCWWYLYCSKGNKKNWHLIEVVDNAYSKTEYEYNYYIGSEGYLGWCLEGKVVARFWCDKVEEISWQMGVYQLEQQWFNDFLDKCCLGFCEIKNYLNRKNGFAIHISKLEIFDKPKELGEFLIKDNSRKPEKFVAGNSKWEEYYVKKLTKAPQNYCYIEEE